MSGPRRHYLRRIMCRFRFRHGQSRRRRRHKYIRPAPLVRRSSRRRYRRSVHHLRRPESQRRNRCLPVLRLCGTAPRRPALGTVSTPQSRPDHFHQGNCRHNRRWMGLRQFRKDHRPDNRLPARRNANPALCKSHSPPELPAYQETASYSPDSSALYGLQ